MVSHRLASVRIATLSLGALVVLCAAFWAWLPFWVLRVGLDRPARMLIGVAAATLIFAFAFVRAVRTLRDARTELARWRAIATSLGVG